MHRSAIIGRFLNIFTRILPKYFLYLLFLPVWWLQLLIKRNDRIWVFGAWNGYRFSDNSRYLFEYVKDNQHDIQIIWLTRDKNIKRKVELGGGKACMIASIQGIYYSLVSKIVFVTSGKKDVNHLFINGATLVNLWHGSPLKKIGIDDKYSSVNSFGYSVLIQYIFPMSFEFNYDYTVSNAPVFSEKMASAFNLPLNRILETGCPRNDVFFNKTADKFNEKLRTKFKGAKLVYYLPTFRNLEEAKSLFTLEDYNIQEIEAFLERENIVFVSKGHYIDNSLKVDVAIKNSRIVHLSDKEVSDINFMLKDADALITDYSSAYFDFLLMERPIVFAAFDLEEYMSASRELYFDYSEAIAGPIVRTWEDLYYCLSTIWKNEECKKRVIQKNRLFNKYHDGHNAQRVCESILDLVS